MSKLTSQAEEIAAKRFSRMAPPSKYIAGFVTAYGLHFALQRTQQAIYCWTQAVSLETAPASPVRTYAASEPRNSNLNAKNCSNLKQGNSAHYWRFEDNRTFEALLEWYGQPR